MTHYEWLEKQLDTLTRRKRVYKILKQALLKHGYWKNKTRGNPERGWKQMQEKMGKSSKG